jgi:hypothetical protein
MLVFQVVLASLSFSKLCSQVSLYQTLNPKLVAISSCARKFVSTPSINAPIANNTSISTYLSRSNFPTHVFAPSHETTNPSSLVLTGRLASPWRGRGGAGPWRCPAHACACKRERGSTPRQNRKSMPNEGIINARPLRGMRTEHLSTVLQSEMVGSGRPSLRWHAALLPIRAVLLASTAGAPIPDPSSARAPVYNFAASSYFPALNASSACLVGSLPSFFPTLVLPDNALLLQLGASLARAPPLSERTANGSGGPAAEMHPSDISPPRALVRCSDPAMPTTTVQEARLTSRRAHDGIPLLPPPRNRSTADFGLNVLVTP